MKRAYIVPKIGDGLTIDTPFTAKYIKNQIAGGWSAMDFGREPFMLVVADVTAAEHASIMANSDAISFPLDLDNMVGANVTTVQSALESVRLPSDWVAAGQTYRFILKTVTRYLALLQRLDGRGARLFDAGLTLDSTVGDVPSAVRTRLAAAATSLGADVSSITPATTLRAALRTICEQIPAAPSLSGVGL